MLPKRTAVDETDWTGQERAVKQRRAELVKVSADDRAGKTVAERIRAATAQDYSKRLDEWESAFGEWRKMSGLMQQEGAALSERVTRESAGGTLERATAAFEPVVGDVRWPWPQGATARQRRHEKELTEARSRQQRSYDGPSLG